MRLASIIGLACWVCFISKCIGWNQWEYSVQWDPDPSEVAVKVKTWNDTWFNRYYKGDQSAPRPRKGHSLGIIKTDIRSDKYLGATYLVMFGGRDNDQIAEHIPKTYNVQNVSPVTTVSVCGNARMTFSIRSTAALSSLRTTSAL